MTNILWSTTYPNSLTGGRLKYILDELKKGNS